MKAQNRGPSLSDFANTETLSTDRGGPRVILIGGSSNVGKTTLAAHLARRPGWRRASTDYLARHPGRPWRPAPEQVPPHVAEHYLGLTTEALIASVQAHYRALWPRIEAMIGEHAEDPALERLVLEGSALWPEAVAGLHMPAVSAIWLTADDRLFETRIHAESRYAEADERGRSMIDKFLERTRRFNLAMMREVRRLGLAYVEVDEAMDVGAVADICLSRARALL